MPISYFDAGHSPLQLHEGFFCYLFSVGLPTDSRGLLNYRWGSLGNFRGPLRSLRYSRSMSNHYIKHATFFVYKGYDHKLLRDLGRQMVGLRISQQGLRVRESEREREQARATASESKRERKTVCFPMWWLPSPPGRCPKRAKTSNLN